MTPGLSSSPGHLVQPSPTKHTTKTWLDLTLVIPVDSEHGDGSLGLFLLKLTQDPED